MLLVEQELLTFPEYVLLHSFCSVLWTFICLVVFCRLVIVRPFRLMTSDFPFIISKLF